MRQIGNLLVERDAQRFTAYLVTQGIDALAEGNQQDWVISVVTKTASIERGKRSSCFDETRNTVAIGVWNVKPSRFGVKRSSSVSPPRRTSSRCGGAGNSRPRPRRP